jgi:elongation factor G
VLFKESIDKPAEAEAKYVKQLGPRHEYAHVKIRVTPLPRGAGIQLLPVSEKFFPAEYFPGVERGLMSALASGPAGRYEVTDVKAEVSNGSYHEVDSSISAFAQAAEEAAGKALRQAEPFLLEPMVSVNIEAPEEFVGSVIGDINGREGWITAMDTAHKPNHTMVSALVPERTLADYPEQLRLATRGRAALSTQPGGFERLPNLVVRQMRYCPGCERKVLLRSSSICPDCGSALGSGDDFASA